MKKQTDAGRRRHILAAFGLLLGAGFLVPDAPVIPVSGATSRDWNPKSFWFEPWGVSGVHKGIDIFAPLETDVLSATSGVLIYRGKLRLGGNVVAVLGPKWRIHYYAHLSESNLPIPLFIARGSRIGQVGTTGNAAGKAPHLHYSIVSIFPLPWHYSSESRGWMRMFYLDPGALLQPPAS
jgi:murein DD-endopeptidase MepM/ murein hydrolase activator NlpD